MMSINILYFDLGHGRDYIYHGKAQFLGLHGNYRGQTHASPWLFVAHVHQPGVASPAVRVDAASSATRPRIALCSCLLEASGTISV